MKGVIKSNQGQSSFLIYLRKFSGFKKTSISRPRGKDKRDFLPGFYIPIIFCSAAENIEFEDLGAVFSSCTIRSHQHQHIKMPHYALCVLIHVFKDLFKLKDILFNAITLNISYLLIFDILFNVLLIYEH